MADLQCGLCLVDGDPPKPAITVWGGYAPCASHWAEIKRMIDASRQFVEPVQDSVIRFPRNDRD